MPRQTKKNPFKGINSKTKKLADGTRVTYYWAYKGGPRLPGEYGSPEFVEAFLAATSTKKAPNATVLFSLLVAYQDSGEFRKLAERTRSDYIKQIKKIEAEFRDFPVSALDDKRTRGIFKAWRDRLSKKSLRQADYAFTVLARVMSWSLDRGLISTNPCEKSGRLYTGQRAEHVWTDKDEDAFMNGPKKFAHLRLPLMFGLWTGQREGDILNLRWSQYDGRYIRLQQGKTGARVQVPIGGPLKAVLDKLLMDRKPKAFDRIMLSSRYTPWTLGGFSSSFRKAAAHVGIKGLTFHDTRGTAVTRLAICGCSTAEIATFTGHSLNDVQEILDTHYLSRDVSMADSALRKLEARTRTPD